MENWTLQIIKFFKQVQLLIALNLLNRKKHRKNQVRLLNSLEISIKRIKIRLFRPLENLSMMRKFKCLCKLKKLKQKQEHFKQW